MKKITFLMLFLVCFVSTNLFSQICSPTSSGNNNSLDWENTSTFTFYLSPNNGNPTYIDNPFFTTGTSCNINIDPFCNNITPKNDISSADGWRYVTHDFGAPTNKIQCPVFVLYNIHSGVLRVFFYKSLETPANSAVIALEYKEGARKTALLENYSGGAKNAVQVFDNTYKSIKMPNQYLLSPHWTHADFVTQYDPCTCQSTSAYTIKLVATANSNISFTINGQLEQNVQASQKNGYTQAFTTKKAADGLSNISKVLGIGSGSAPNPYANVFNSLTSYFDKVG